MTTIRIIEPELPSSSWSVSFALSAIYLSIASAFLLVCGAMGVAACMFLSSDLGEFLTAEMQQRTVELREPSLVCSEDNGEVVADGRVNCFDYRGFRVVVDDGVRIFSLRYSGPLFIFGMQKGMVFVNEHISERQLSGEKDAFLSYLND